MQAINVTVVIQMDINENKDTNEQVRETLELLNTIVSMSKLESQPQIIIDAKEDLDIWTNFPE